ncbi:kelch domain-containing protein [Pseudomassariella vexata]|uniref:Kelch domain-containing protein n=1 Tax=Pseudomassariella vexata TaxID=1141098 RepID=A0A1Y2DDY4_9PEZI|nr:kelch domain-containing protein [Pseudomassariella vexata]ORY57314.1 kelch domain-containing protein [Pseudomassariella vexata]
MEHWGKLKRRTNEILSSAHKNMPNMPNMPSLPTPAMPKLKSGSSMKGTWQHVPLPPLPRSSHSLNVVAGSAYIFGGEVEPRKPVDNDMHIITLPFSGAPADYYNVPAKPSTKTQLVETIEPIAEELEVTEPNEPLEEVSLSSPAAREAEAPFKPEASSSDKGKTTVEVPSPRVGHATAVIGSRIFLFGGRSAASETLDEGGRVWVFETKTHTWSYLDPAPSSHVPPARSFFSAVATEKPRDFASKSARRNETWKEWAEGDSAEMGIPQRPIAGSVAASATDEEDAGYGTFIIHGGGLRDGSQARDVWAFDVRSHIWKELPPAPGVGRVGMALAIAKSRLYRFGGFDGEGELGGQLDVLELTVDEFDDNLSKGEVGVFARGDWISLIPASQEGEAGKLVADEWPGNRSVGGMELVMGGGRREYLVLLLGEKSPSGAVHEAAGQFWGDVWAFQVPPLGMSTASVKDAVWQVMGRKTGEGKWTKITPAPFDEEEDMDIEGLAKGENGIFLFGGVNEKNRRQGDGFIFRLG